jgi:threonine dehydrogenase-like Zn-dependent dehydrogenase
MGVAAMTAADARVENHAKPTIPKPPTRLSGCRATCIYGSDLWRYRGDRPLNGPRRWDTSTAGIVDEIGSADTTVKPGQFAGADGSPDDCCSSAGWLTAERPTTVQPQEPRQP